MPTTCKTCGAKITSSESEAFPPGTIVALRTHSQLQDEVLEVWCSEDCFERAFEAKGV